jgi:hypothetical protein
MATITSLFSGEPNKTVKWGLLPVATGHFVKLEPYVAEFVGNITFPISLAVRLRVLLLDENEQATSGPASVVWNELSDDNARYTVDGDRYILQANLGGEATIIFRRTGSGTAVEYNSYNLMIEP